MTFRVSAGILLVVAAMQGPAAPPPVATTQSPANPPAIFSDPDRRAKLATAFPEIDRLVGAFMERTHVPGAAWGIVIDDRSR